MEPRRKQGEENGLQQIALAYWKDVVHEEEEEILKRRQRHMRSRKEPLFLMCQSFQKLSAPPFVERQPWTLWHNLLPGVGKSQ